MRHNSAVLPPEQAFDTDSHSNAYDADAFENNAVAVAHTVSATSSVGLVLAKRGRGLASMSTSKKAVATVGNTSNGKLVIRESKDLRWFPGANASPATAKPGAATTKAPRSTRNGSADSK